MKKKRILHTALETIFYAYYPFVLYPVLMVIVGYIAISLGYSDHKLD